jgi:hemolysin activation/secretion protein
LNKRVLPAVAILCGGLTCIYPAYAQLVPDAGSVLRELERAEPPPKPPAPKPELRTLEVKPTPADAGGKILVRAFRITGATLIPADELSQELSAYVGSEHTVTELRKIALRLSDYYRKKGYFARALIPQQRVQGGVVEVAVIEGRLAAVDVEVLPDTRYSAERARKFILRQQPQGEPLSPDALQAGMRNLNDQPGVLATGVLQQGDAEGDVKLSMRVESTPLISASAYVDNHGLKATGRARAIGFGNLNSPFGYGDQISLLGVITEGSNYERLGYSLPLGYNGLRADVSAAHLGYRLSGLFSGFNGTATILGASLSQPLRRTNTSNLYGSLAFDHKRFVDDAVGGINLSDKSIKSIALNLRGDFTDDFYGGARNIYSLGVVAGRLDLDGNAASLAADRLGAQTQGSFTKLPWNYQRVQRLADGWDLSASFSGQFASKNLDGYEKFAIGGPSAVRAYPSGEGLGDEGWIASLEVRRAFTAEFQGSVFVDSGHISVLHNTYPGWNAGNPARPNSYSLYGAGIGMAYGRPADWVIRGSVAWKLGSNPGRTILGTDSDGGTSNVRGWIQLAKFF